MLKMIKDTIDQKKNINKKSRKYYDVYYTSVLVCLIYYTGYVITVLVYWTYYNDCPITVIEGHCL